MLCGGVRVNSELRSFTLPGKQHAHEVHHSVSLVRFILAYTCTIYMQDTEYPGKDTEYPRHRVAEEVEPFTLEVSECESILLGV